MSSVMSVVGTGTSFRFSALLDAVVMVADMPLFISSIMSTKRCGSRMEVVK